MFYFVLHNFNVFLPKHSALLDYYAGGGVGGGGGGGEIMGGEIMDERYFDRLSAYHINGTFSFVVLWYQYVIFCKCICQIHRMLYIDYNCVKIACVTGVYRKIIMYFIYILSLQIYIYFCVKFSYLVSYLSLYILIVIPGFI